MTTTIKNAKVSIIVPVYNVSDYLNACLASLVSQTHSNIEIILVDDGSTDGSSAICDAWADEDPRITVIHKANGGLSSARNTGLEKVSGDFVLFVDSDDLVSETVVELALNKIAADATDICLFKHLLFDDKTSKFSEYKEYDRFPSDSTSDSDTALLNLFHQRIHNYAVLRLVRTDLYRSLRFSFPEGMTMEDLATTAKLLSGVARISYLNMPLYYYRTREGSIVSTWNEKFVGDLIRALGMMEDSVRDNAVVWVDAENYALKMLFYCWMMIARNNKTGGSLLKGYDALIEREIASRIRSMGVSAVSMPNIIKYFLLRAGLLRGADSIRVAIQRARDYGTRS